MPSPVLTATQISARISIPEETLRTETALAVAGVTGSLFWLLLFTQSTRRGIHASWGELLALLPFAALGVAVVWAWRVAAAIEIEDEIEDEPDAPRHTPSDADADEDLARALAAQETATERPLTLKRKEVQ
jgi:hypothetical protein